MIAPSSAGFWSAAPAFAGRVKDTKTSCPDLPASAVSSGFAGSTGSNSIAVITSPTSMRGFASAAGESGSTAATAYPPAAGTVFTPRRPCERGLDAIAPRAGAAPLPSGERTPRCDASRWPMNMLAMKSNSSFVRARVASSRWRAVSAGQSSFFSLGET